VLGLGAWEYSLSPKLQAPKRLELLTFAEPVKLVKQHYLRLFRNSTMGINQFSLALTIAISLSFYVR
jgi:hypothetical protein